MTMKSRVLRVVLVLVALVTVSILPTAAAHHSSVQADPIKIVFDYSHGEDYDTGYKNVDHLIEGNLTEMGYEIVWARGGLNSTILEDATGLIIGSMWGDDNGFQPSELDAIEDWFASGNRLLWVSCKSDYPGPTYGTGQFCNDNATAILERVGSHAYPEPAEIDDFESNCGEPYRVVANITSTDPFVASIVSGLEAVLFHGSTVIYGSDSDTPGENINPVPLENESIENVYPLIYSSPASFVWDRDTAKPPLVHENWVERSHVLCTLEVFAGPSECGVIIVSGNAPYGRNRPIYFDTYYDVSLDGHIFVKRAIDEGIRLALNLATPIETATTTTSITNTNPGYWSFEMVALVLSAGIGAFAIAVIVVLRRRK
jgi:hypothetical protein